MINKISEFLLLLGIVFSQFYIFDSGTPQPAHYLIAIALISILFQLKKFYSIDKNRIFTIKILAIFVIYQGIINSIFFIKYTEIGFILQATYILYGFLIFLLIVKLFISLENFEKNFSRYSLIALIILFTLPFLGLGQYALPPRYNAFFNDPNQMALWVLCITAICIYYFGKSHNIIICSVIFFISGFLIYTTASRSGFIGFLLIIIGMIILYLKSINKKANLKFYSSLIIGLVIIFIGSNYIVSNNLEMMEFIFDRVDSTDYDQQAELRGYKRFIDYPEYILFGSGHGNESRFSIYDLEIHSTWAGVLFYYGIFGFLSFLTVIFQISSRLSLGEKFIFFAPLFYSFSTFGLRTPIFWIFLGFFYTIILNKNNYNLKSNA